MKHTTRFETALYGFLIGIALGGSLSSIMLYKFSLNNLNETKNILKKINETKQYVYKNKNKSLL